MWFTQFPCIGIARGLSIYNKQYNSTKPCTQDELVRTLGTKFLDTYAKVDIIKSNFVVVRELSYNYQHLCCPKSAFFKKGMFVNEDL